MTAVHWQAWDGPKEPREALWQRRPGQVLRTSHVDTAWTDGVLVLHAAARDVRTGAPFLLIAGLEVLLAMWAARSLRGVLVGGRA